MKFLQFTQECFLTNTFFSGITFLIKVFHQTNQHKSKEQEDGKMPTREKRTSATSLTGMNQCYSTMFNTHWQSINSFNH